MTAVVWKFYVDTNDDTDYADTGEDLSALFLEMDWQLGFTKPLQHAAPLSTAKVTLDNTGGSLTFSDYIHHRAIIQSIASAVTRTHFTGHIKAITCDHPFDQAVFHLEGLEAPLHHQTVQIPIQIDKTADEIIQAVTDETEFRLARLFQILQLDVLGKNTLGLFLGDTDFTTYYNTGLVDFPYAGDHWNENHKAIDIIQEAAQSDFGYFYADREGKLTYIDRHSLIENVAAATGTTAVAIDIKAIYGYSVNSAIVFWHSRELGAADTTLFELQNAFELPAGETIRVVARFRDDYGNPIGAYQVDPLQPTIHYTANREADGSEIDLTPYIHVAVRKESGSSLTVEFWHNLQRQFYVTAFQITGTPLYPRNPGSVQHTNYKNATAQEIKPIEFDLPLIADPDYAHEIAKFIVARYSQYPLRFYEVEASASGHTIALSLTIFDKIFPGHADAGGFVHMLIIGEHHIVKKDQEHKVHWICDMPMTNFFVIGTDTINGTQMLGF